MAVIVDTSIVTIYDTKNKFKPLTCHRIDAREFLAHPKRWSTSPDGKSSAIGDAKGNKTPEDTGEAMKLKAMSFKALQGMAEKAAIPDYERLEKPDLVKALLRLK